MRSELPPTPARPTSPRAFAQLMLAGADSARRKQILDSCPPEWRALALHYVNVAEMHRDHHARQREKLRPTEPRRAPVTAAYTRPALVRGNSAVASRHLSAVRASLTQARAQR